MFARKACIALGLTLFSMTQAHSAFPSGFSSSPLSATWDQATGLCFAADGRLFVWEKAGRVWLVENGVKSAAPLLDITEEVANWRDHGLLGFAIDPAFLTNGRIYLLYVVDYHHLAYFGTPQYNPAVSTDFHDTIARLTRYTCNATDGFHSVDPSSRVILDGESMTTGIPICHQSHGPGSLVFGEDGTLLVSCGDGGNYLNTDAGGPQTGSSNTALVDGIITPAMDIGAFRAQLVNCLNGKILRLDPQTGDGVASNPFFDPLQPRAPRSRVWALGLRNPFRFCLVPGTGSPEPKARNPGVLMIGDVGWNEREEINICNNTAQNFGWPLFEGLTPTVSYPDTYVDNLDAPNPLFNTTPPGQLLCPRPYFQFQELLIQATLAPNFPNFCDPAQEVPPDIPHFIHRRPAIDWFHGTGPSRTGIFNGSLAAEINIGTPGSPVSGPQFGGRCALAGLWYTGAMLPQEYQNTLFVSDYDNGWIRNLVFNAGYQPTEVRDFAPNGTGAIVCFAQHPVDGSIWYLNYNEAGQAVVHRLAYQVNASPTAVVNLSTAFGPAPLTVQFNAAGSFDPDSQPLTYQWNFGDNSPPDYTVSPIHVYRMLDDITAQGSITARIFSLNPPTPTGSGNYNPEIIRDNVFPPVGSSDSSLQYDTFHGGDQGSLDWIGYTFFSNRTISAVGFQEGKHFSDGGWFNTLNVQVLIGAAWQNVSGLSITPSYPGNNGIPYEYFFIAFNPVSAKGVRLSGNPGGSSHFISIGELRVFEQAASPTAPRCISGSLTVTDSLNGVGVAPFSVALNNTPPDVQITSPINGTALPPGQSITVPLTASISDAEHAPNQLTCQWQTILHHNDHIHPEPYDNNCASSTVLDAGGHGLGLLFYEIQLRVADPDCLATTQSVFVYPSPIGDADCNGVVNLADVDPFVLALLDIESYQFVFPTCNSQNADIDQNSALNGRDIAAFVNLLLHN